MIELRLVESAAEAEAVASYFRSVWADGPEVVPADLIIAGVHVNAYSAAAWQDGEIVGASFGIQGSYRGESVLHSHVTAATVSGVGYQLKQHQRQWASGQNISAITWTFDPLVRRNCYFNFSKLGATAVEYLPNFYGAMTDSINAGEESDRLFAIWKVSGEQQQGKAEIARVELPEDIESLRRTNLTEANAWRAKVRLQLAELFAQNATISSMTPDRKALIVSK